MAKKILRALKVGNKGRSLQNYIYQRQLLKRYGLNNKDQLKRSAYQVEKYKKFFRTYTKELPIYKEVTKKLCLLGIISNEDSFLLDQITVDSFLERRLQTIVAKKFGLSLGKARQMITQRQVRMSGKIKDMPSFLLRTQSEKLLSIPQGSNRKRKSQGAVDTTS